jgi:PAS domain S-box-containing protein
MSATSQGPNAPSTAPTGEELLLSLLHRLQDQDGASDPTDALTIALPTLLEVSAALGAGVVHLDGEDLVLVAAAGAPLAWDDARALVEQPGSGVPASWAEAGVAGCVVRRLQVGTLLLAMPSSEQATLSDTAELALGVLESALARIAAQEQLADLTARVDNAQQLALMGDYDWHIPTDTNRWSDQLYRIYGHEPQSFNASYERFISHIHPDDRDRIMAIHQHAYATGEPYQMIERVVRPDGEIRYLSSNGQVIMDEAGNPVRMRGTCVDITERVLAEDERVRVAARFRSLVESSPDAIVVADPEGTIVQGNGRAAELLGGDPVGHPISDILTGEDEDSSMSGVSATGFDGRALRLDVSRAPLHEKTEDGHEDERGLVAVFLHDATARLANEAFAAHLQEAQLRRHQALEINDNVVQGLTSALYALEMGDTTRSTSYLRRTLAAAGRMIDDLVMPLSGEDLQASDLVRATASTLDPLGPDED